MIKHKISTTKNLVTKQMFCYSEIINSTSNFQKATTYFYSFFDFNYQNTNIKLSKLEEEMANMMNSHIAFMQETRIDFQNYSSCQVFGTNFIPLFTIISTMSSFFLIAFNLLLKVWKYKLANQIVNSKGVKALYQANKKRIQRSKFKTFFFFFEVGSRWEKNEFKQREYRSKRAFLMVPMHQETHNSKSDSLIRSSLVVQGQNENFERNVELNLHMSPCLKSPSMYLLI